MSIDAGFTYDIIKVQTPKEDPAMNYPVLVHRSEAPLTQMQELCSNPSLSCDDLYDALGESDWDDLYDALSESDWEDFNAWIDSIRYDEDMGDQV